MDRYMVIGLFALFVLPALAAAEMPGFGMAWAVPSGASVSVPEHAAEVAPGVFSLGKAVHEGRVVEGYMVVKKAKPVKPTCNNDGKCQKWEDSSCADCSGGSGKDGL